MVTSRYVVTLRDDVADVIGTADKLAKRLGGVRRHVYGSTIKGFSLVNLSDRALAELRADPAVVSVGGHRHVLVLCRDRRPSHRRLGWWRRCQTAAVSRRSDR